MGWIAVVLNDSSGSGDCTTAVKQLEEVFAVAGREARILVARGGDELRAAAERSVKEGCDSLVAGGGDGTINTCASAALAGGVPLGVLPLGTLNHFAKDLGIPLELADAAQVVLDGLVCQVDVGEVNGRVFLNNSSIGVYPAIVRLRERYQKTGWGKWVAALWAGLTVMRRHPFLAVRIIADGESIVRRTPFVFIGNNEYRMEGMNAGARDSLAGGHLALYVLNAERRTGLLQLAWQVFRRGAAEVTELDLLAVEEATIETRRAHLQVALDGEVVPMVSPLAYRVRRAALQVHVPPGASACYPHPPRASSSR